ncbi:hypothetical protein BD309DRAFT_966239 [Dichomitus squalens]|nr:hypothetical protein BD309DRAFT_966239 [Dichomitus squalens]
MSPSSWQLYPAITSLFYFMRPSIHSMRTILWLAVICIDQKAVALGHNIDVIPCTSGSQPAVLLPVWPSWGQ